MDNTANGGGNLATVKKITTNLSGWPMGTGHSNPLLDSREYEVELEDGTSDRIFANKIAKNIYSQINDKGREIMRFRDIIDHRKNGAAIERDDSQATKPGKPRPTTKGWQVLVEWADETTTWMNMKDVKEASPVELAEYAVANKIDSKPVFA